MHYTLEVEIARPRDKVIELFMDGDALPFWQPGFMSMEPISGEPGEPGSKVRLLYKHGNKDVELIETVTVANMPEEFSGTYEAKGMLMEVKNHFKDAGPEKTLLVSENKAEVRGILMNLITIIMPGCFKKQSLKYLTNFKAFAETGADCREAGK